MITPDKLETVVAVFVTIWYYGLIPAFVCFISIHSWLVSHGKEKSDAEVLVATLLWPWYAAEIVVCIISTMIGTIIKYTRNAK